MLCLTTMKEKVPYFNAPIYLQNKTPIGKVDEILGPINQVYFSIKMDQGMVASSFKNGEKVYVAADKLLPLERFLPKPKPPRTSCSFCDILFNNAYPYFSCSRRKYDPFVQLQRVSGTDFFLP